MFTGSLTARLPTFEMTCLGQNLPTWSPPGPYVNQKLHERKLCKVWEPINQPATPNELDTFHHNRYESIERLKEVKGSFDTEKSRE